MYLDAISREKLRKLCKFGRLFEADRLLQEKGTARFRKTHKWTPLFVAVDRGFHSLVEVLLRYEHEPWDLEKAYSGALRRRRNDLAAMILKSLGWTREIDPVEAICAGDVELVKSMILDDTNFTKAPIIRNAAMNNPIGGHRLPAIGWHSVGIGRGLALRGAHASRRKRSLQKNDGYAPRRP